MIVVFPRGGLCNRMSVIDSAIAVSKKNGHKLYVLWALNKDLNCKFEYLFKKPPTVNRVINLDLHKIVVKIAIKLFLPVAKKMFFHRCIHQNEHRIGHKLDYFKSTDRIYVNTWSGFYFPTTVFSEFKVINKIERIVNSVINKGDNVIGVHIRRTDHTHSISRSPLKLFIKLMEAEIKLDNETKFFIATDDPETEEKLSKLFSNKIIIYPKKTMDRNNPKAIVYAAIDLYCLSNCRKLIGSHGSTFTTISWSINDIEHVIADIHKY